MPAIQNTIPTKLGDTRQQWKAQKMKYKLNHAPMARKSVREEVSMVSGLSIGQDEGEYLQQYQHAPEQTVIIEADEDDEGTTPPTPGGGFFQDHSRSRFIGLGHEEGLGFY